MEGDRPSVGEEDEDDDEGGIRGGMKEKEHEVEELVLRSTKRVDDEAEVFEG